MRGPAIRSLAAAGTLQLSLFDERDLAEVSSPDYPGERLVICRNPLLADERTRKRQELPDPTAQQLLGIQARVRRANRPLRGKDKIALAVGGVEVAKHFALTITDDDFSFARVISHAPDAAFLLYPKLTALQERAFQLLDVPVKL